MTARRQLRGDGRGDRRLADAAFAHHHHQPAARRGDLVDERRRAAAVRARRAARTARASVAAARSSSSARSAGRPTMLKARSGTCMRGQRRAAEAGISRSASRPRCSSATATASVRSVASNTALTTSCWFSMPERLELAGRAIRFAQRARSGPRHEHDGRALGRRRAPRARQRTAPPASSARSAGRGTTPLAWSTPGTPSRRAAG